MKVPSEYSPSGFIEVDGPPIRPESPPRAESPRLDKQKLFTYLGWTEAELEVAQHCHAFPAARIQPLAMVDPFHPKTFDFVWRQEDIDAWISGRRDHIAELSALLRKATS